LLVATRWLRGVMLSFAPGTQDTFSHEHTPDQFSTAQQHRCMHKRAIQPFLAGACLPPTGMNDFQGDEELTTTPPLPLQHASCTANKQPHLQYWSTQSVHWQRDRRNSMYFLQSFHQKVHCITDGTVDVQTTSWSYKICKAKRSQQGRSFNPIIQNCRSATVLLQALRLHWRG